MTLRKRWQPLTLVLAMASCVANGGHASPRVGPASRLTLPDRETALSVGVVAEMLVDRTATLSAAQVASAPPSRWRFLSTPRPNFGYTADAVWFRFSLQAADSGGGAWILDIGREWLEHVDLYRVDADGVQLLARSGARLRVRDRSVMSERPAVRIALSPRERATYLLRIQSRSPISFKGELRHEASYWNEYMLETFVLGGFYAILIAMALYNLLLFIRLREPAHGWLAAFILTYALGEMASHGHFGRLLDIAATELRFGAVFFCGSIVSLLAFRSTALPIARRGKLLYGLYRAAWIINPAACAVAVVAPERHWLAFVALGVNTAIVFAMAILSVREGSLPARYLVAALACLLVPGLVAVTTILGAFPVHAATEHGNHVGAVLMVILLSLAVAEKIEQVRIAATRFVPRDFLAVLGRRDVADVRVGDAREVDMTVMFVDLRDFTSAAEHASPREVFARVNDWFRVGVPVIARHGGFVDKFIGDAIMALFPSPVAASRAALELRAAALAFFGSGFAVGIGIHRGPMVLGTIGDADRLEVSVIADCVNVASRVEALTRKYGVEILVTREVADAIGAADGVASRWVADVQVKGRAQSVEVLELVDPRLTSDRLRLASAGALKTQIDVVSVA